MKYNSTQQFWPRFFGSRIFVLVLIVFLLFISYSIYKEKKIQKEVDQNIKTLESEISSLENDSLELSQMIKYLRSDEFVEREAREKLNLKKVDEKVVIIPDSIRQVSDKDEGAMGKQEHGWRLWIEYFFGRRI